MTGLPCYPGCAPIEFYGNGGFRFAGMSHRGSILCLPQSIQAWSATQPSEINTDLLDLISPAELDILVLGTGPMLVIPPMTVRRAFHAANIALEFMDTGAAVRTYNILLAEQRRAGAALIAVA